MSEAAEKLLTEVLALPEADRLALANRVFGSVPVPPGVMCEDDPGFDATLARRIDELRSGKVKGTPGDEVMDRLRKKYAR